MPSKSAPLTGALASIPFDARQNGASVQSNGVATESAIRAIAGQETSASVDHLTAFNGSGPGAPATADAADEGASASAVAGASTQIAAGVVTQSSAGACPACSGSEIRVLFSATDRLYGTTDKIFRIVECGDCRLIRLDPQPTPTELRDYYPPGYWFIPESSAADRLEQRYRRFVLRDHLHFVERALRESQAQRAQRARAGSTSRGAPQVSEDQGLVLDVGCGGGLFLQMLSERRNVRVAGLDFSLDAASMAWRRAGVPAVCATLSRPPFAPESCAAITMFHVLEHLYDPPSYLDAAHKLLRPDGRLILQVPNAACWQFLLLGERWNGIDVPRHLTDFRLSDIDSLLSSCGFEVLRYKHFSLRDNPAGMATSLAPMLDPMARRLRGIVETPRRHLWKDLLYVSLVCACVPFTLLEAACRAGSTIMVEARKKS
jgi:SAM-dependent methyltransferase